MKQKVDYLIVDTSAFIKNTPLQEIGENVYTSQDVVDEITSKRQLKRLVVLPYDLKIKEPFTEDVKFVTDFSKKTGDYPSLSATDIKVIALTYLFEKERNGTDHLRTEPVIKKTVNFTRRLTENPKDIVGFYLPPKGGVFGDTGSQGTEGNIISDSISEEIEESGDCVNHGLHLDVLNCYLGDHSYVTGYEPSTYDLKFQQLISSSSITKYPHVERWYNHIESFKSELQIEEVNLINVLKNIYQYYVDNKGIEPIEEEVLERLRNFDIDDEEVELNIPDEDQFDNTGESDDGYCESGDINEEEAFLCSSSDNDSDDDENDDDGIGWITPENIREVKKKMGKETVDDKPVEVACISTDFSVQNVLKQIGLNVVSIDGRIIRETRTFVLRCYSCFKTTTIMTKIFCPNCGNKTLKRVSVTLNEDGSQQMYISCRKPLTGRGKKFSLPKPKSGKHANNPILCEDQPIPQQRPSRLARVKNNPLNSEYLAGFSPFVTRDTNSRAARLGIYGKETGYWTKKNPNEVRKPRRRKK